MEYEWFTIQEHVNGQWSDVAMDIFATENAARILVTEMRADYPTDQYRIVRHVETVEVID